MRRAASPDPFADKAEARDFCALRPFSVAIYPLPPYNVAVMGSSQQVDCCTRIAVDHDCCYRALTGTLPASAAHGLTLFAVKIAVICCKQGKQAHAASRITGCFAPGRSDGVLRRRLHAKTHHRAHIVKKTSPIWRPTWFRTLFFPFLLKQNRRHMRRSEGFRRKTLFSGGDAFLFLRRVFQVGYRLETTWAFPPRTTAFRERRVVDDAFAAAVFRGRTRLGTLCYEN